MRLRNSRKGFTMIELMVVIFLLALVMGLLLFNGRRGMANREQDKAAKEIESAINLTRQTATNRGGATLRLVSGDGTNPGSYEVLGGPPASLTSEKRETVHRSIRLTGAPDLTLVFQPNGSLPADYTITVASFATNLSTTINVARVTGGVRTNR